MNNFFKKLRSHPCEVELLSVHIPKTAGTSFRLMLIDAYGKEAVAQFDYKANINKATLNGQDYLEASLPKHYRVFHGHFKPKDIYAKFKMDPTIPMITWLRNPVEQVLSNYYYQVQLFEELVEKNNVDISPIQRNLLEFAGNPQIRNRSSRQLEGKPIDDFFYVGIVEQFEQDVKELSALLGWKQVKIYQENITKKQRIAKNITDEVRAQIAEWNQIDMELYNYVLAKKKTTKLHLV